MTNPSQQRSLVLAALHNPHAAAVRNAIGGFQQKQGVVRGLTVHQFHQRPPERFDAGIGHILVWEVEPGRRSYAIGIVTVTAAGFFEYRIELPAERDGFAWKLKRSNGQQPYKPKALRLESQQTLPQTVLYSRQLDCGFPRLRPVVNVNEIEYAKSANFGAIVQSHRKDAGAAGSRCAHFAKELEGRPHH